MARSALLDPRIARRYGITTQEVDELCRRIEEESIWRPNPTDPPRRVPKDSGDDYLVALALENDADLLVTRDRHFDGLSFDGIRIEFPGAFLARLMS